MNTISKRCSKCDEYKLVKEFCTSKRMKDGYQSWCKKCMTSNTMSRYNKNKKRFNERNTKYRQQNVLKVYEFLKDKYCTDCGDKRTVVLEFDHLDPDTKIKGVMAMCHGHTWNKVKAEMDKCEIVCANCHKVRTANRNDWNKLNY